MIKTFQPIRASVISLSLLAIGFASSFAEDEIKEPPSYGSVIETQTTNRTLAAPATEGNPSGSNDTASKPEEKATANNTNTQSKVLTSTISLGQTKCPDQTSAIVMGVVGGSIHQRSEVVCVPNEGYQSTPHFLAHYALEKLGGGFSMRAIDHVQVMLVRKGYEEAKAEKRKKHRKQETENETAQLTNSIESKPIPRMVYKPEIYRFSSDWPRFFGFNAEKQNKKLLAATNNGDLQAIYVTVDGVSDSAIFGVFNQTVSALGPNAGTLGLAAVGLVQAGN